MNLSQIVIYTVVAIGGVILVAGIVNLVWLAMGAWRIRRAGPRRLTAAHHVLWRDPGNVEALDLTGGPGGTNAPAPPFQFVEEHLTGSQPCVSVTDAAGRRWRVKWGDEVRSENFAVRLAWACGFFAETTYFLASGTIEGAADLQRAKNCIGDDCRFADARFELDDPAVRKLFEEHSWAWNDNPFIGTQQFQGLKILVMLLSDWDTKDRRDVARGSNTAIFEHRVGHRQREARYLITDWGGSMGRWGSNIVTRARWDLEGFEAQTPEFVVGVDEAMVRFGYTGQRTADVATGITVSNVAWLYQYLGRVTDVQLEQALRASGASPDETERFTRALRDRINQLGRVCGAIRTDDVSSAAAEPAPAPR